MIRTVILILSLCFFLPGCRLVQIVSEGGSIISASRDNDCAEASTCIIDVENGSPFSETFFAQPNPGYVSAGWGKGLCQGKVDPCVADVDGDLTDQDVDLKLEARFVQPGTMHLLFTTLGVGAVGNDFVSALQYGFAQADLLGLSETEPAIDFTGRCEVRSFRLSRQAPTPPGWLAEGFCYNGAAEIEQAQGPFALDLGGVSGGARLPVDLPALAEDSIGFSTSVVESTYDDPENFYLSNIFLQGFVARQADGAQIADLAGDWILTRLSLTSDDDPEDEVVYTTANYRASIAAAEGATLSFAGGASPETQFLQHLDGSPLERRYFGDVPVSGEDEFPVTLESDGAFAFLPPGSQVVSGFATPNGDYLFLSEGVPNLYDLRQGGEPPTAGEYSAYELMVGVRHNDNPLLQGRKYRIVGLTYRVTDDQVALYRWTDKARLQFTSASQLEWRYNRKGYRIEQANANLAGAVGLTDAQTLDVGYSVDSDGRILFDLAGLGNLDGSLVNGYASPDNRVLVFSHGLSFDGSQAGEIGLWLGLCTNCDQ